MYYVYSCVRSLIGGAADTLYPDPPVEVLDGVYIGSLASVRHAADFDIIINVSGVPVRGAGATGVGAPCVTVGARYEIPFDDVTLTPENMAKNIAAAERAARILAKNGGKRRLVHCAAGVNRSAFVIGLYLLGCGYSYTDAMHLLAAAAKKRRVAVLTNNSFRVYLLSRSLRDRTHQAALSQQE